MLLVFLATAALGAELADVPLPPPPAGMQLVDPQPAADDEETPDAPSEVDELKALEDASLEPGASRSDAALREQVQRLGLGNALRERLEHALEDAEAGGEPLPFALDPVTDVASFDVSLVKDRYDIPV